MKYYYLKRHKGVFKYYQNKKTYYGYRLTYYDSEHKRHEKSKRGFSSVDSAVQARNKINNVKSRRPSGAVTVKDWCLHYIDMIKPPIRKITTYKSYRDLLRKHVIPTIGKYKLKKIRLDTYQSQCLNHMVKQGLSRTTIKETNARVQAVMNYAVKTRYLKLNPLKFANIPMSAHIKPKREIMSSKQLKAFNQNLKRHSILCQTIYFTLEDTGLRVGELLGLHYKDLDFRNRILKVNYTRDGYSVRKPKTPHSKRKLIIPVSLAKLLKSYTKMCKQRFNVNQNSLVIVGKRHGKPLTPNIVPDELKRLLIESGLKKLVGRFVPHSFRHMFASRLINQGVSIITVSKMLGHANPDITLKIYANAVPNSIPDVSKYIH